MEETLAASPFLAGPDFTCADIMSVFNLVSFPSWRERGDIPNTRAYLERVTKRPAYIKAMKIAGPTATPPAGA
jgi:glutathione S-transferase